MSEFNIQSESIDVERIMEQIREKIEAKHGNNYTEEHIQELASIKFEQLLDLKKVRDDLVRHYSQHYKEKSKELNSVDELQKQTLPPVTSEFDANSIYRSSRGVIGKVLFVIRKLLNPILKLFFNPTPIVHAVHTQNEAINWMVKTQIDFIDRAIKLFDLTSSRLAAREKIDDLNHEIMNHLVIEMTRLSIEMKNHRLRVESIAGRLDFDERRIQTIDKVTKKPTGDASAHANKTERGSSENPERRKRRRRRSRKRPSSVGTENASSIQSANTRTLDTAVDSSSVSEPDSNSTPIRSESKQTNQANQPSSTTELLPTDQKDLKLNNERSSDSSSVSEPDSNSTPIRSESKQTNQVNQLSSTTELLPTDQKDSKLNNERSSSESQDPSTVKTGSSET